MLYTFNLNSDVCQLFLNKTGGGGGGIPEGNTGLSCEADTLPAGSVWTGNTNTHHVALVSLNLHG